MNGHIRKKRYSKDRINRGAHEAYEKLNPEI